MTKTLFKFLLHYFKFLTYLNRFHIFFETGSVNTNRFQIDSKVTAVTDKFHKETRYTLFTSCLQHKVRYDNFRHDIIRKWDGTFLDYTEIVNFVVPLKTENITHTKGLVYINIS